MLLIGNKKINTESPILIKELKDIDSTPANSTVIFEFDLDFMLYCQNNNVPYAVILKSIKEAIYANNVNAKYIICQKDLAAKLQTIATNYMFDSRVLAIIEKDDEIEELALANIDGIIYKELLS